MFWTIHGASRLVETRTAGTDAGLAQLIRYQFTNHLDSATLELDDQAQIISYEEYFPYGSTSYQAVRNQTDTPKRYRYTGKERDEENDLYYHGARYYAPWLGRWTGADPMGIDEGLSSYWYARDNPVTLIDRRGMDATTPRRPPKNKRAANSGARRTHRKRSRLPPRPSRTGSRSRTCSTSARAICSNT
jgi:RHS repeat-associated protein